MKHDSVHVDGSLYDPYDGVILSATMGYSAFWETLTLTITLRLDGIPDFDMLITGCNGRCGFSNAEFFQYMVAGIFTAFDVCSLEGLRDRAFRAYLLYEHGSEGPMPVRGFGSLDGSTRFLLSSAYLEFEKRAMLAQV